MVLSHVSPTLLMFLVSLSSGALAHFEERADNPACEDASDAVGPIQNKPWYKDMCFNRSKECPSDFPDPPLLLISLDGFRSDLLSRGLNPTLERMAECGAKAPFMRPSFPSATFPNHVTLVTGLFPESHGIIDSKFYDPVFNETFRAYFRDPKWWNVEPIWSTVERSGKKSATFFWVGSDVKINGTRPSRYFNFPGNNLPSLTTQIEVILSWLDLPKEDRPAFMTLYSHEPDSVFHNFGPESSQGNVSLGRVEKMFQRLMSGLHERKLLGCINIIVVSDHGMTASNESKWIYLHKYANLTKYRVRTGSRTRLGNKDNNTDTSKDLIGELRCKNESFVAYPKEWLPKRYHYSDNRRIDPIVVDLEEGYFTMEEGKTVTDANGTHGYDVMLPTMQAFFLAYGKDFKQNVLVRPFRNVEVYGLMTEILNISARPNNGTPGALNYILENPAGNDDCVVPSGVVLPRCKVGKPQEQRIKSEKLKESKKHTPWGQPQLTVDKDTQSLCSLVSKDYISGFDPSLNLSLWTSFTLKKKKRRDVSQMKITWQEDTGVEGRKQTDTAQQSSLAQMRLYPLGPGPIGEEQLVHSNMNSVPIYETHSATVIKYMHKHISYWTRKYGTINVVVGPAFDVHGNGKRAPHDDIKKGTQVPVPTHVFFVITRCLNTTIDVEKCPHGELDVMAFLLPNLPKPYSCYTSTERYVTKHMATVKDVETLTGLRFFAKMSTYDAMRLRTQLEGGLWST